MKHRKDLFSIFIDLAAINVIYDHIGINPGSMYTILLILVPKLEYELKLTVNTKINKTKLKSSSYGACIKIDHKKNDKLF
jgi:hypothetical protein